jgi:hypothetical protein
MRNVSTIEISSSLREKPRLPSGFQICRRESGSKERLHPATDLVLAEVTVAEAAVPSSVARMPGHER